LEIGTISLAYSSLKYARLVLSTIREVALIHSATRMVQARRGKFPNFSPFNLPSYLLSHLFNGTPTRFPSNYGKEFEHVSFGYAFCNAPNTSRQSNNLARLTSSHRINKAE
jgi:hypothetical protein